MGECSEDGLSYTFSFSTFSKPLSQYPSCELQNKPSASSPYSPITKTDEIPKTERPLREKAPPMSYPHDKNTQKSNMSALQKRPLESRLSSTNLLGSYASNSELTIGILKFLVGTGKKINQLIRVDRGHVVEGRHLERGLDIYKKCLPPILSYKIRITFTYINIITKIKYWCGGRFPKLEVVFFIPRTVFTTRIFNIAIASCFDFFSYKPTYPSKISFISLTFISSFFRAFREVPAVFRFIFFGSSHHKQSKNHNLSFYYCHLNKNQRNKRDNQTGKREIREKLHITIRRRYRKKRWFEEKIYTDKLGEKYREKRETTGMEVWNLCLPLQKFQTKTKDSLQGYKNFPTTTYIFSPITYIFPDNISFANNNRSYISVKQKRTTKPIFPHERGYKTKPLSKFMGWYERGIFMYNLILKMQQTTIQTGLWGWS